MKNKLLEILDEKLIFTDVDSVNKKQVVSFLSKKLKEFDYIDDELLFQQDIYKREAMGQTGIGEYIAIPHGISVQAKKVTIAIAKLAQEIEWETLDDKGVKLVFLFCVPEKQDAEQEHLYLLAELARKLGNDIIVNALYNATNETEIINSLTMEL